jgi:hypothetical protein
MLARTDTSSGNRTMPSAPIYRAVMQLIEAQRLGCGLSMAEVERMSGLQDGFYSKMIYPDTPSGRQARWDTVQLAIQALFGKDFAIHIVAGSAENRPMRTALRMSPEATGHADKIRRWRDRKHFAELGRLGGASRAKLPKWKQSAIGRKAAKARWRRVRAAKRQGDAHKAANAKERVT